jgi:serine/threonine-protein kinase RsbW
MSKSGNKYNNRMTIKADLSELITIRDFVMKIASDFGFPEDDAFKISLAVDEACTNLIKYAYNFNSGKYITIEVKPAKNQFVVNIKDEGQPFDPEMVPSPDMKEYLRRFNRGGLGIFLMKSVMDEISYTPSSERNKLNILRLAKYLT